MKYNKSFRKFETTLSLLTEINELKKDTIAIQNKASSVFRKLNNNNSDLKIDLQYFVSSCEGLIDTINEYELSLEP